jgi:HD-GYP domain-containing protein (c-di-GMP phosphodiesterase class II)
MADLETDSDILRVVAQLNAAVTSMGLYASDHPQASQAVERTHALLGGLLADTPELTFMLIGDDLVAGSRALAPDSAYVRNFVRVLQRKGVERVTFGAGLPKDDLRDFIHALAKPEAASIRSTSFITLGKVELRVQQTAGDPSGEDGAGSAASSEMAEELKLLTPAELDELKGLYLRMRQHRQIDMRGVDEVVRRFVKGFREEVSPLMLLASVKSAHEYTFTHASNVGILTMCQAESLGFTGEHLHLIGVAALLHDTGKIFIPEEIMNKQAPLTQDERKIIETHTTKGARHLLGTDGIPKLAVVTALEHHLKYDGTGYPSIKGGWTPNIASQMISIADVFDAMRSRRAYQEPQPMSKIRQALVGGKGKAFNPVLVDNFFNLIKL